MLTDGISSLEAAETSPKFSVVVPTRNRARTLRHTLATCLDQTFGSFEVVVSDNFSDDETPSLIAELSAKDTRLRGVRTSSYISMSRNFANGLQHARGENVIFIGDDDGLLPYGLELLARVLDASNSVDAVRWRPASFWWPHAKAYYFRVSASDYTQDRTTELAKDILPRVTHPQVLNFFEMTGFTLYHGCWRRSVIDRAIADGVDLFDGPIPDVLSSIYGLHYARACLCLEAPVSIMGVSGKSNGWATSATDPTEDQKVMREDFATRSRKDFPDAPPITFSFCACSPYLGSLLSYWLRSHGSLAEFDHEAWRAIFLNQMVFLYGASEELRRDYNDHTTWLRAHGASNVREISSADVAACRERGERIPDVPKAAPAQMPSLWHLAFAKRDTPRLARMPLKGHAGAYFGTYEATGNEFTVKDFADLKMALLGLPRQTIAHMIEADVFAWQRSTLAALERRRHDQSIWTRPFVSHAFAAQGIEL